MAFNKNIPQPTDKLKDSQSDMLNNFDSIYTVNGINHVNFDDASGNQGKHKHVTFPEQAAAPATAINEAALYAKQGTGAVTQLFYRPENNGTEVELTYANKAANGYTYLPSGILLRWGTSSSTGDSSLVINTAPFFNAVYSVQLTANLNDITTNNKTIVLRSVAVVAGVSVTLNVTGVQRIGNIAVNTSYYWFIIGV